MSRPSPIRLPLLLLGLTVVTTTVAGLQLAVREADDWRSAGAWLEALGFSGALLFVLGIHELGHKVTADRIGVQASWPYFIPVPPGFFLIGTLGAIIHLKPPFPDRNAALRIGAAGPIAGFAAALIVLAIGFRLPPPDPIGPVEDPTATTLVLGEPLAYAGLQRLLMESVPDEDQPIHPVVFAGWVGLFLTALNLLPIGQFDGGHVLAAIAGPRRARSFGRGLCLVLLALGAAGAATGRAWPGWIFWAAIGFFLTRMPYPSPVDPDRRLDRRSIGLTVAVAILFALCFHPQPIRLA